MQLPLKLFVKVLSLMVLINHTSGFSLIPAALDIVLTKAVGSFSISEAIGELITPLKNTVISGIDTIVNNIPDPVRPYVKKVTDLLHVFTQIGPTAEEIENAHYYDIAKTISDEVTDNLKEFLKKKETSASKFPTTTEKISNKNFENSLTNMSMHLEANRIIQTLTDHMNAGFNIVEKRIHDELEKSTRDLKDHLNNIRYEINENTIIIENYITKAFEDNKLTDIFNKWGNIKRFYKTEFENFFSNHGNIKELENIENTILGSINEVNNFVNNYMTITNDYVIPKTLFIIVGDILDGRKTKRCESKGAQWNLYGLYLEIITEISKIMDIIIHVKINKFNRQNHQANVNFEYEKRKMETLESSLRIYQTYSINLHQIAVDANNAINKASNEIRTCDPIQHVKDETYQNFVRIQQGYIGITNTEDPDDPFIEVANNNYSTWASVTNCSPFSSEYEITVYSDTKNMEHFFEYVEIKNGTSHKKLIHEPKNRPKNFNNYHPKTYTSKDIMNDNIQKCIMTYEDELSEHSVRFVSLQPKKTLPNYFVTGIRLKIINRILHFEIQQGKMSNGKIVDSTIHWLPSSKQTVYDRTMLIDVSKVDGFIMQDVKLEEGSFLTGVKFEVHDYINDENKAIKLIATIAQGQNITTQSNVLKRQWLNSPAEESLQELKLNKPDSSIQTTSNVVLSKPGENYISIQVTDMTKDASQSMVPYLDIQALYAPGLMPFRGIGMYYRGSDGFGGFIGLKAFSHTIYDLIDTKKLEEGYKNVGKMLKYIDSQITSIENVIDRVNSHKKNLTESVIKEIKGTH